MLTWYENNGRGVFSGEQTLMASDNPLEGAASMSLADLDQDGDMDVAVATLDSFVWVENLGEGEFSPPQRIAKSIMLPSGVSTADLDGDGDADVVATTALDSRTMWYENVGDGTFMARHVISRDTKFVTAVKTQDIDADGDLDVLTTSFLDGAIVWHENTSGRFLKSTRIGQMDGISDLAVFDMDGDQDLDMVASTSTVDRVVWFENTDGHATFSEGRTIQSNIRNVRAVDSADINGDGLADIVLASYAHDIVGWFRQAPQPKPLVARKAWPDNDSTTSQTTNGIVKSADKNAQKAARAKATDLAFALHDQFSDSNISRSISDTQAERREDRFRFNRSTQKQESLDLDDFTSDRTTTIYEI